MKRRQQAPKVLVSLARVDEMKSVANGSGLTLGGALTLTDVIAVPGVRERYRGLWQAASQVATAQIRNMGTLGGNLCLDTRCSYYDQNHEWRKAIDFCMKKDGAICWVATASKRCVAVSSTDCAPALLALGASVRLASKDGERVLPLAELYRNDGIDYLTRRRDEILTDVLLPEAAGWRSCYWKLRRRGSFDFPVLGVAAAAQFAPDGTVLAARVALGAAASQPFLTRAGDFLGGKTLSDDVIAEAGRIVASRAKPMDNTDFDVYWRKDVVAEFVALSLRELRGDDVTTARMRYARRAL
jgi:4-hydroxybenzoyl-CoA reductase subunit beta